MRLFTFLILLVSTQVALAAPDRGLMRGETDTKRRVALVIGNGAYAVGKLRNPVNDARGVAARLKQLGFEVTPLLDADQRQMEQAARAFTRKLHGENVVGLFYYAGHGLEVDGQNYLVPIGAEIQNETEVKYEAVNAGRIFDGMRRAGNGLNLVILDACRNNPYSRGFRGGSQGLKEMRPASGTLILYAAEPGEVAGDGQGNHGVFTEHLLAGLKEPGLTVEQLFKRTARQVKDATGGRQTPWQEGMILGQFSFLPAAPAAPAAPLKPQPNPELMFWSSTTQCGTAACYQEYLKAYPNGRFAGLAKVQIQQLEATQPPPPQLQPSTPELIPFTVKTTPEGARVRILNIGPKYQDSMELKPGRYRIEATKSGYKTHLGWHELTADSPVYVAELEVLPPEPQYNQTTTSQPQNIPAGKTWRDPVIGMEFVQVPGGCYQMGSMEGDSNEKPVHEVCVDGFWLGKYEVTQGQWKKVMGSNPSHFKTGDSHPVEMVSWNDVQDFIRKLNGKGGAQFRLPTEAEWEYACRSGGKDEIWSGTSTKSRIDEYGNICDRSNCTPYWGEPDLDDGYGYTAPVGRFHANSLGLHDMTGNVYEWVQDAYATDAYSSHNKNNPLNSGGGSNQVLRVKRGGNFRFDAAWARCAFRLGSEPNARLPFPGFRLLRK